MKYVPLTNSIKMAIVDDDDYEKVMHYKWSLSKQGYAMISAAKGTNVVNLHRFVMGCKTGDNSQIDHKNCIKLDCRKSNLRPTDHHTNAANRPKLPGLSSQYKGVTWNKRLQKWVAQIKVNQKHTHLGTFGSEIEAARAYDRAAMENFGEFARLNSGQGDK